MGMMTPVVVAITEENYRYAPFDGSEIIGPMAEWLAENVKSEWTWDSEIMINKRDNELPARFALVVRFADPAEAALFKLTWQ